MYFKIKFAITSSFSETAIAFNYDDKGRLTVSSVTAKTAIVIVVTTFC